jgi:glycosidase
MKRTEAIDGGILRFEFHVSREARDRYHFDEELFSWTGNVLFANIAAARRFAARVNEQRDVENHPELTLHPGALNAMALIDEMLHAIMALYREQKDPAVMTDALGWYESRLGAEQFDRLLVAFVEHFPPVEVYRGNQSATSWLAGSTGKTPHRAIALEELIMLWLANVNPAFTRFRDLFSDDPLARTAYPALTSALKDYFATRPKFGALDQNLIEMLRHPALASPESLEGQLAFMRENWQALLGEMLRRILLALDIFKEEEVAIWMRFHPQGPAFDSAQIKGDSSAAAVPHYTRAEPEYERFSADVDWMPKTVMIAKTVFVWLDQLSKQYHRPIQTLDQIPDEELDVLARRGFNALWLIGLWERSRASQRIKQIMGNPEAASSAYSLWDYNVANDLGGENAYQNLRHRAMMRGIRMGTDMVPNHMAIDSPWVIQNPDRFLSLPYPPFPAYRFNGPDLSSDGRVEIKIDDGYYDRSDAAVVFMRHDRWTGDRRYIYHGNDGTSFPWNDTAQLNYLNPEVRETVMQNILRVARLSPIIRFDAAMTLTKQHYQRLWFPQPGTGGAIPSRAEQGMSKHDFDAAMPYEFWREVVDRVAAEVPGTLLLAEAFWLLEGYFVRTLGMHRVYNSAFMNMLRDEENANYRNVIKNTLEFDPEILKRHVNFMNNPDERTAVDQFGKGDKYFGVCTLMATFPGLPMFGHGQVEGYAERYGMEYRRAYHEEWPDTWLVARHEREITPLLYRRALFAEVREFLLYDFFTDSGSVNEDVYAYSNRLGDERALVIYHNRYSDTSGWIRMSAAYADKWERGAQLRQRSLAEALGLSGDPHQFVAARDSIRGLEFLYRGQELAEKGMRLHLGAYQCHVLLDFRHLFEDQNHPWGELCDQLGGKGVSSLADAMFELQLKPIRESLNHLLEPALIKELATSLARQEDLSGQQKLKLKVQPKESASKKAAKTAPKSDENKTREEVLEKAAQRAGLLLDAVQHLAKAGEQSFDLSNPDKWRGDRSEALKWFRSSLDGLAAPAVDRVLSLLCPTGTDKKEALKKKSEKLTTPMLNTILAWAVLLAIGKWVDPEDAATAGVHIFDALKMREQVAQIFESAGLEGEERWRAAARVRALLHHPLSSFRRRLSAAQPLATLLRDPDVAWLLGVHEYDGTHYFVKEPFEQLLRWMGLPALLEPGKPLDETKSRNVESEIQNYIDAGATAGYRVESFL